MAPPESIEELRAAIEDHLSALDSRERNVVALYYGLDRGAPRTPHEVAKCFDGMTPQRVVRIVDQALKKL